ncbi:hypothetical protein LWF01_02690 [Saxibacter everestensis]|uniref:Uncharacterized protein n=1 Tax=Saxibacter everestensis TaxID=2909229 RepID=A0ABY8QX09_9MICO|nr:hypothetical protein LWF01_02690 [Brevibacteriaceae bacterium ZFBP1038]
MMTLDEADGQLHGIVKVRGSDDYGVILDVDRSTAMAFVDIDGNRQNIPPCLLVLEVPGDPQTTQVPS